MPVSLQKSPGPIRFLGNRRQCESYTLSFAIFEADLAGHLRNLRAKLVSVSHLFRGTDIGKIWIRPKAIDHALGDTDESFVVTVPEFAHDHKIASMSVRVLLEPNPLFATSEVIWLRVFGPALETLLDRGCRANRLHLQRMPGTPQSIPVSGRRVYRYWAPEYRLFRDGALLTAKSILNKSAARRCVLTTLDMTSYFDNIDPSFLLDAEFITETVEAASKSGTPFDPVEYAEATAGLLESYAMFWATVGEVVGVKRTLGLPIGALTSRLVANLALVKLDRFAASRPSVRYYARYVDDILIVEEPGPGDELPARGAVQRLVPLDATRTTPKQYVLDSTRLGRPRSNFMIQATKLRVFDLNGEQGLEYLDAVQADMQRVSSERRRFLDPWGEELDHTVIASPNAEPVRVLRDADALSLRKLAVNTVSDKVETAAAMLNRDEARRFSRMYLGKAGRLATDWSRWVDLLDVSLRILGAALMSSDEETANEIVEAILQRAASLDASDGRPFKISWGESELVGPASRRKLREWVEERLTEVVCASVPFDTKGFIPMDVNALKNGMTLQSRKLGAVGLFSRTKHLAAADLRLADRETDHAMGAPTKRHSLTKLRALRNELVGDEMFARREVGIKNFLSASKDANDDVYRGLSVVELLLMVRPPSYFDVLFRWLRAERPVAGLLEVVNAVRGTRYMSVPMTEDGNRVRVASDGSFSEAGDESTDEDWWKSSLTSPVLTVERQKRLARILNHAIYAARYARGRPTLLVLPELSLPRRWVRQVCMFLNHTTPTLSMVAGLEYDIVKASVFNEAFAYLPRPFHSASAWIWTKRRPAHHEGHELTRLHFSFAVRRESRRFVTMLSDHGAFIPLICSELLEVDTRSELLGSVDLVLVPAWNSDTTSFEYLVHSAPLELHSFIAVANNGIFSDCRIRAPYSETWQREVCRLIARNGNEAIVADLAIGDLRAFQRDSEGYPAKKRWKPVPPGYVWRKG
jgi:hypothetical protein